MFAAYLALWAGARSRSTRSRIASATASLAARGTTVESYFGNGSRWGVEIGYSFEGKRDHGEIVPNPGTYLEVVPNRKLVFTDAFTEGWAPKEQLEPATQADPAPHRSQDPTRRSVPGPVPTNR